MARGRQDEFERQDVIRVIEEGFHLLRLTPVRVHALYLIGSVPFALGVIYFWTDMSRSADAGGRVVVSAGVVAALYLWMKAWQAVFGAELVAELRGEVRAPAGPGGRVRALAALAALQATAIPVQLVAAILTLPLGWAVAFYQNVSVLALSRDFGRVPLVRLGVLAARQSHHRALQNHGLLLMLFLFALFVWLNVHLLVVLVPQLVRIFTGVESAFTTNVAAAFGNSTATAVSLMVTMLCVGPLTKAIYAVRCFRGVAESSGEDLLARLRAAVAEREAAAGGGGGSARLGAGAGVARGGRIAGVVVWIGLAVGVPAGGGGVHAAESDGADPVVVEVESAESRAGTGEGADELAASIREVLEGREYQWRLPRGSGGAEEEVGEESIFERVARMIREAGEDLRRQWRELWERVDDSVPDGMPARGSWFRANFGLSGLQVIIWVLFAAVVGFALWMLWRSAGQRRREAAGAAGAPSLEGIDLESDEVSADALEENEWLALARSKAEAGEFRLAVRALFLACLASLADRGVVRLQRFKSNRDYQREVAVRARGEDEVLAAFEACTGAFERTWYGDHEAGPELIGRLESEFARINRGRSGGESAGGGGPAAVGAAP